MVGTPYQHAAHSHQALPSENVQVRLPVEDWYCDPHNAEHLMCAGHLQPSVMTLGVILLDAAACQMVDNIVHFRPQAWPLALSLHTHSYLHTLE